jgi:Peptidase family M23
MRPLPLTFALALALLALLAGAPPALAAWTWPLAGEVITPYRNGDDPYAGGQHRGVDIAGAVGAPVVAAAGGEVLFAGTAGSSGVTVSIRTAEGLDTSYLHLSSVSVRKGDRVSAGGRLGAVGTTGRRSAERPHLHFGVRVSGSRHDYRDPLAFLPPPPAAGPRDPLPSPVPADVPVRIAPEPAPLPRPGPIASPEPRRVPVGRRIPGTPRVPAARRAPQARRVPAPGGARAPVPAATAAPEAVARPIGSAPAAPAAPASRRARTGPDPRHQTGRAGQPVHSAAAGIGPRHAGGRGPHAQSASPGESSFAARPAGSQGPDLGWALACLGLLLAAGILGLTSEGRDTARRSAGRLSTLLRPLTGRG